MSKYIFMTVFCTYATLSIYAQTSDAEAEALVNLLGVQKKEAIRQLVSIPAKDSTAFWKLYDAYQKDNKDMAMHRIKLYEQTATAYSNMSPAAADSLARKYFTSRTTQEKSLEEYYKKIKSATNAIVAFQFYQAEVYLQTLIRASIMEQVPTYGEIRLATKKKE